MSESPKPIADSIGGIKQDSDKPRVDLVPSHSVLAAARAFTFGAVKYSPWNWMKGLEWLRLYGAVLRHMYEFIIGVTKDKESGLHPLDHALASLMMLQTHVELSLGKDDRPHVVLAAERIPAARVPNVKEKRFRWFYEISDGRWEPSDGYPIAYVSRAIAEQAMSPRHRAALPYELREVEID